MKGVFVLSPERSTRLISKAVLALTETKRALEEGFLVIGNGTTNSFIASRITGESYDPVNYSAGIIENHTLSVTPVEKRLKPLILFKGEKSDRNYLDVLPEMTSRDVFLKGANAIDSKGNAGILVGGDLGGTIGRIYGQVIARSVNLIMPVSSRKLIPSVDRACEALNGGEIDMCEGIKARLFPVRGAKIITETDAIKILYNLHCEIIASGGHGDSCSDIVILAEGAKEHLTAFESERR
ncbi:hypothetical protein JXL83_02670 [candidate division WOR-3 bacterium]|nr:hypothetical protein [candidate division WOR-3 bacterium]